jgi:hypothetical protein
MSDHAGKAIKAGLFFVCLAVAAGCQRKTVADARDVYEQNSDLFHKIYEIAHAHREFTRVDPDTPFQSLAWPSLRGPIDQTSRAAYERINALMQRADIAVVERDDAPNDAFVAFTLYTYGWHSSSDVIEVWHSENPKMRFWKEKDGTLSCSTLRDRNWYVCEFR